MDNWQQYLEIRVCAEPKTNDFGEINSLWLAAVLVLKTDYADRYIRMDGAAEVKKSGQNATTVTYDPETEELTLVSADTLSSKEWTNTVSLGDYGENGLDLGASNGTNPGSLEQNGTLITAVSQFYKFIEITRMEGTLCLTM